MSKGRDVFNLNVQGTSINWFDNGQYLFVDNNKWTNVEDHVWEEIEYSANATGYSFGSTGTVQVYKQLDQSGMWFVKWRRGALGTGTMFNDHENYSSIKDVEIIYNNRTLWKRTGKQMYDEWLELPRAKRTAIAKLGNGELTDAERVTSAADSSTTDDTNNLVYCYLPVPWESYRRMIFHFGLPNQIEVKVTFKTLAECTDSASSTCTISSLKLRVLGVHVPQARREQLWAICQTPLEQNGGFVHKVTTYQSQTETIASGTTSQEIKLPNITGAVYDMRFTLNLVSDIDTASATRDLNNYQLPTGQYWIVDNQQQVTDKHSLSIAKDKAFSALVRGTEAFPEGEILAPVAHIYFCPPRFVRASDLDCYTSRDFQYYKNPILTIEFPTATSAAMYCYIDAKVHNLQIQNMGDIHLLTRN